MRGTYRIIRKLGSGGEGRVYLAIHERTCQLWAVKVVPAGKVGLAEGGMTDWIQLMNPGLPRLLDIWNEAGHWYFVMEYISGMTLKELVGRKGKQSTAVVANWLEQLCLILEYLHCCNPPIIYSDMKPENIICREDGRLFLTDFGAMRRMTSRQPRITGTAGYAAPEQYQTGAYIDQRADIYALGRTMQELLAVHQSIRSKREKDLIRLLEKCTREKKEERYGSCILIRKELARAGNRGKRLLLGSLASGILLIAAAVSAAEQEQLVKQDDQYLIYLNSNDISTIKSAIILNPYRDEAYQKLLEQILEDEIMEPEEERIFRETLVENEKYLCRDKEHYADFAYQTGIAYWYYFAERSGKKRAAAWFEKALDEETLSETRKNRCDAFQTLGNMYEALERKIDTGEGAVDYREFWETLKQLGAQENGESTLKLQIYNEILSILGTGMKDFLQIGIRADQFLEYAEELKQKAIGETGEDLAKHQKLIEEIVKKYNLIKKSLDCLDQR